MPDAVSNIEEELRKRGLLATGGNIRMMPFDNATANGASQVSPVLPTGATSATANALAANSGGGLTVSDVNGNPIVVDPNATTLPANVPDSEWLNIWPAVAGATGAGIGFLIAEHFKKRGVNLPATADAIPTMEGVVEPNGVPGAADIVDGEFTEVADDLQLSSPPKKIESGTQKLLQSPQSKLAETLTQRKIGKSTSNLGTIQAGDSYSDLSSSEMKQAETIADQLVQRRLLGNQSKTRGKAGLPTGDVGRNGLLNVVVKAIRDAKLNPTQVRKAVGR